jgi:predicted membrane chloride channel (bestrophin family)
MISISLLGIDQAATHIEDPFGTDPSGTSFLIFSNK